MFLKILSEIFRMVRNHEVELVTKVHLLNIAVLNI